MRVAVIDIGKTNAKLVLIDTGTGAALATLSMPNRVVADGPYPHADTDALWDFILEGLRTLVTEHGFDAISITTHGATAALVDDNGLVLPVLDYEHDGPEGPRDAYESMRPPFSDSLTPRLPNGLNLGAQLFWQHLEFEAEFARARYILTYPQYWAWLLTGITASEVTSLGCHTDLWSHPDADLSSLVVQMNWRDKFPPLKSATDVLGPLRKDLCARIGLAEPVPVACGIHDSNASLLPHLTREHAPFSVVSTGTWAISMTVGGDPARLDSARDSLGNVDAFGRTVPTARFMAGREFDLLAGTPPTEASDADLQAVLARDIQVLPGLMPGVGPYPKGPGGWNVDATSLSPGERYAAASLYLALVTETCLELCGLGHTVIVEGPLARNSIYCRALARWTSVPVKPSADATGTSLGAAVLFGGTGPATAEAPVTPFGPEIDAYRARWREKVAAFI
jgi:sugar (pentulose or hexulose) kinase